MNLEFDLDPDQIIKWSQFLLNFFAIGIGAWIYKSYTKNLKSQISSKDEQIRTVEKRLDFWKDKAVFLENRSPEFVEKRLDERIKIREDEMKRLSEDKETHKKEIDILKKELLDLKIKLGETKEFKYKLAYIDKDLDIKHKVMNFLTNYMAKNRINFYKFYSRECTSDFLKEFNMESGLNLSKLEIKQYLSEIKYEKM